MLPNKEQLCALLQQSDIQSEDHRTSSHSFPNRVVTSSFVGSGPSTISLTSQRRRQIQHPVAEARHFLLRSSAAVVFWPRWRPGWASSWPGSADGSPRSPAPSEGPERPDGDAAPPPTTCSPADRNRQVYQLNSRIILIFDSTFKSFSKQNHPPCFIFSLSNMRILSFSLSNVTVN